jgi:uncharacterized membrane protein YagU involved in acid resistance
MNYSFKEMLIVESEKFFRNNFVWIYHFKLAFLIGFAFVAVLLLYKSIKMILWCQIRFSSCIASIIHIVALNLYVLRAIILL